ncbi:thiol-disulfide isomerase/thioredoxin [Pedobacter africanus]|uniref:TlpA disulfide reductase family protein n=1 Tax=Pedobacter africanus TaxID=151894 RepID=UPI0033972715
MKITQLVIILILGIGITSANGQKKETYIVSGKIEGTPDGTVVYLIHDNNGHVDSMATKIQNEKFVFKGKVEVPGQLYFVKMDTSTVKFKDGIDSYTTIMLDNSDISIKGQLSSWPDVKIDGSPSTSVYWDFYKRIVIEPRDKYRKIFEEKSNDSLAMHKAEREYRDFLINYLNTHPDIYFSPFLINSSQLMSIAEKKDAFKNLPVNSQNSYYGIQLKNNIATKALGLTVSIGKLLPDFSVNDLDGKPVKVRTLIKQAKYTLIDFWAWWCTPCRADIPNMKKVYNAFHDNGFNILSISTDTNVEKWKKAIKEENTPWMHAMDYSRANKLIFDITAIPGYILVNEKGEMIAFDMPTGSRGKNRTGKGLRVDLYEVIDGLLGNKDGSK